MVSNANDQIRLALKALNSPSRRAEFLFNPSRYAKKENLQLDPRWIKVIEKEFDNVIEQLIKINGKFDKPTQE